MAKKIIWKWVHIFFIFCVGSVLNVGTFFIYLDLKNDIFLSLMISGGISCLMGYYLK